MDIFPAIFYELYDLMPRQGPGTITSTRKAFRLLPQVPADPKILDIGCGSGVQTLELAKLCSGKITALDNHQPFLDTLESQACAEGLDHRIRTVNGSMFELPFDKNSFDLIWSEGAIYIMGFEKGLREWKPLIKKGGYLVVSELSWTKKEAPEDLRKYWQNEYPAMKNIAQNKVMIRRAGYTEIATFKLPKSGWQNYYKPLQKCLNIIRNRYNGDPQAGELLDTVQQEIDMYYKYSDYYSYVFYVMLKPIS